MESKSTKICSNHFEYGRPTVLLPHPKLFLKGYGNPSPKKRKPPTERPVLDIHMKNVKTADANNTTEQDEDIAGSSVFTTNQDHLNITVHDLPASTCMSLPPPTSSLHVSPNIDGEYTNGQKYHSHF